METEERRRPNKKRATCGLCIYIALVGLVLLGVGWGAILKDAVPAATTAFVLGGGALFTAPFVSRLEGTLRIGPVELGLRQDVIRAAELADEDSLAGVLPLLTSDTVAVARVQVPRRFVNRRLVDDELQFLRQRLNVSVVGVLEPGSDKWRAGGEVSELELPENGELLVAGHADTVAYLRLLIASDDEELWRRVS